MIYFFSGAGFNYFYKTAESISLDLPSFTRLNNGIVKNYSSKHLPST